jgi:hypothetical protein
MWSKSEKAIMRWLTAGRKEGSSLLHYVMHEHLIRMLRPSSANLTERVADIARQLAHVNVPAAEDSTSLSVTSYVE